MDACKEAVEKQRKCQEDKGWKTPRWDWNWIDENPARRISDWQEGHKCERTEEKGLFIGLLAEASADATILFKTTNQKLETKVQTLETDLQAKT